LIITVLVLVFSVFTIQESFAEESSHLSTITKNGLYLTLETDKSEYVEGEIVDITWSVTNISSDVIKYETRSTCDKSGIYFTIFDSDANRIHPLSSTTLNIEQNDPLIKKFDSISFYGEILEMIKTNPDKEVGVIITGDKDEIENTLRIKHGITEIGKGKYFSFVGAKVQVKEVPEIASYDFVHSIVDGEQGVCGVAMGVEFLTPGESLEQSFSWNQLVPSINKKNAPTRISEGQYLIKTEFHGIVNCLTIKLQGDKPDFEESDISCGPSASLPLDQDTEAVFEDVFPKWMKNNARWWAEGQIDDGSFINSIQYMIDEKIIHVPKFVVKEDVDKSLPSWIKNNAKWWAEGQISESDFIHGIKHMVENGIIKVN
jgi:hypothetical protein